MIFLYLNKYILYRYVYRFCTKYRFAIFTLFNCLNKYSCYAYNNNAIQQNAKNFNRTENSFRHVILFLHEPDENTEIRNHSNVCIRK